MKTLLILLLLSTSSIASEVDKDRSYYISGQINQDSETLISNKPSRYAVVKRDELIKKDMIIEEQKQVIALFEDYIKRNEELMKNVESLLKQDDVIVTTSWGEE